MILALSERLVRVGRIASMAVLCGSTVIVACLDGPGLSGAAVLSANSVVVGAGQTLTSIAARYGTTVAALEAANGLTDPNHIVAGSELQLPGGTAASNQPPSNGVVVGPGQTLTSIAARYGTTAAVLESLNELANPNHIVAGSTLQLPGGSAVATGTAGNSVVVGAGQTLTSIAAHYGTTVGTLESLNGLANPNHIVIGSVLQLPNGSPATPAVVAPSTSSVVILPGQTLTSIAAHYGFTVAALESVNGLANPNHIVAGMRLRLPQSNFMALAPYVTAGPVSLPATLLAHPDRLALRPVFAHWAAVSGVPPALLEAMCWWESGWQATVSSVTGAIGVCQLEPATVTQVRSQLGLPSLNPNVASDNIEMSAAYLHQLLGSTGGDSASALAGYYQGLASVHSAGWFASTQQYVKGVLAYVPYFG